MIYRNPRMDQKITDLMKVDHVVAVMTDGRVIDTDEQSNPLDEYAPEVYIDYDGPFAEAQISDQYEHDMATALRDAGWEVLSGYAHDGPYVMHTAQYIGGALEERIREEPGFWVKLNVDIHPGEDDPEHEDNGGNGESDYVGWIVARKIGSEDAIAARTQWIAEDVAMSMPVIFHKGESEEAARAMLTLKLTEYAGLNHIRMAGESAAYLAAADDIENGEVYSVRPGHRIQRVRAMLMPKENNK